MQFDIAKLQVIRSITQRGLALYWDRLRKGRPLPSLPEFEPDERTHDPRQLLFCSVENEQSQRRYRILHQGTRIAEAYDSSWADKYLDEVVPEHIRGALLATYDRCTQSGNLVYTASCIADADGRAVDCERLLLPFGQGTTVTHTGTSLQLISIDGAFAQQNILGGLMGPLEYSVAVIVKPGFASKVAP